MVFLLSYAELNKSSTIAARVNLACQVFIYFSWLSLNFSYHWSVFHNQDLLHQEICNSAQVNNLFCVLFKGVGYCSSINNILSGFAVLYGVYQLVRAYNRDKYIKPVTLFDGMTYLCIMLILCGYIIWTVAGVQLTGSDNFSLYNSSWVKNWCGSFPMHASVGAMIGTATYSIQNPNRFSVVAAAITSLLATVDLVPMFISMAIAQLKSFGQVCTAANYSTFNCTNRLTIIGGIGIATCAAVLLTVVVGMKFTFMPIVGTQHKVAGASDYTVFPVDQKLAATFQQDRRKGEVDGAPIASTPSADDAALDRRISPHSISVPEYSPYVSVRYPQAQNSTLNNTTLFVQPAT
jgi:hypothetical protein